MMKKLFLLFITVLLIYGCRDPKQDENTLPAATQEGKNTGGALVNGQVWVAKIEGPDLNPGGNNTTYNTDPVLNTFSLQIVLNQYNNLNSQIVINISDNQNLTPQTYPILGNGSGFYNPNLNIGFYTDSANTGILTITRFDKVNKIVSGTFSFKAVNSAGEVVNITEGRFDRKFL